MEFNDGIAKESGVVKAFDYSSVTKELLGSNEYYVLAGSGLPANSTLEQPPTLSGHHQAIWNGDRWDIVEDYRGMLVYSDTGVIVEYSDLGELPAGYSLQPNQKFKIAAAVTQKSTLLNAANAAILPLQDAVDLAIATEEEIARLKEWKKYRVLLNRVDTASPVWPETPSLT